jgi:hypothetical protein
VIVPFADIGGVIEHNSLSGIIEHNSLSGVIEHNSLSVLFIVATFST